MDYINTIVEIPAWVQILIPNFTNITIIHEYVVNGGDAATNYTHTLNGATLTRNTAVCPAGP